MCTTDAIPSTVQVGSAGGSTVALALTLQGLEWCDSVRCLEGHVLSKENTIPQFQLVIHACGNVALCGQVFWYFMGTWIYTCLAMLFDF